MEGILSQKGRQNYAISSIDYCYYQTKSINFCLGENADLENQYVSFGNITRLVKSANENFEYLCF